MNLRAILCLLFLACPCSVLLAEGDRGDWSIPATDDGLPGGGPMRLAMLCLRNFLIFCIPMPLVMPNGHRPYGRFWPRSDWSRPNPMAGSRILDLPVFLMARTSPAGRSSRARPSMARLAAVTSGIWRKTVASSSPLRPPAAHWLNCGLSANFRATSPCASNSAPRPMRTVVSSSAARSSSVVTTYWPDRLRT